MQETKYHELNIDTFHTHGTSIMLTNAVKGGGEAFHYHCAKNFVPRLAKETLEQLRCGVGDWTVQGFEHRSKQSK